MVTVPEIRWTLDPMPRIELMSVDDLFALDGGDLLEYAFALQNELAAVRSLLHEAGHALARVKQQRQQTRGPGA